MPTNIVQAQFGSQKSVRTRPLYQWDYGQVLLFEGLDLPVAYEVHFSNVAIGGTSVTQIGDEDGVSIPDILLTTGRAVYAWVYLHTGEDDGETMYTAIVPVVARPQPTNETPTPVQQDAITEAIAALNRAVTQTGKDAAAAGLAKDAAEAAQTGAEAALGSALAAQGAAEAAAVLSFQHAAASAASATAAGASAGEAQQAQTAAEAARDAAHGYSDDAADSATRAEQAASTAGYMKFEIDERGHLIYTRVGYHDTMFSLRDGHLILGVS